MQKIKETEQELKATDEEDQDSYESSNTKTSLYMFGITSAFLLGGYMIMEMNQLRFDKKKSSTGVKVTSKGKANIGGDWQLTDTKGNTVTHHDLEGKYYLIYFGFTNCPDICPLSLHKLANAVKHIEKMAEKDYFELKTLFVSVDPDRDTPEKIEKFLSLFDSNMLGLTAPANDSPNLRDAMNKFRIYASKIEYDLDEEEGEGKEKLSETRK
jgi:cytochrome oxidase Cu insertion factor (SCO1/SenC/PrrC family)